MAKKAPQRKSLKDQEEVLKAGQLLALGEMAAGIAHEINTPLNVILSQIDLLQVENEFPSECKSALDKIASTVESISSVIKGLKTLAKVDTNHAPETIQLNDFIEETTKSYSLTMQHLGIRLIVEVPDGDFPFVCHPWQLGQVILNLVNNAMDAVRKLETKWIKIELGREPGFYVIRVTDSGDGIPQQHLHKIMTPFYTTKKTGTGLGLSLSTAIVRELAGTLTVDTESAHTRFEVKLPVTSHA